MIKKILLTLLLLLLLTPFLLVNISDQTPPSIKVKDLTEREIRESSQFYNKEQFGIHQAFLFGTPFERGQQFGFWTKDLLQKQEDSLLKKLDEIFPKIAQYGIFFFSMGWFYGLDDYFQENWTQEMYGVSKYAPQGDLYFTSTYTRQLAYHGIHDLGQMMIDHGLVLGACTQILKKNNDSWLIGRNFDFEAGPVFDQDKVLKWVFPENGYSFVSIIFSGMVGVITGINEHGVYIAINAAGSDDFTRLGTPTTLIALKALQNSRTADEAVEIIKNSKPLITDIFVVADKGPLTFIVEKTPKRVQIIRKDSSHVVTNHLQHEAWKDDKKNKSRKLQNTSIKRFHRGNNLLNGITNSQDMVDALRDKVNIENKISYGHRASIDALIASHSIVFEPKTMSLYVSKGPSLSNEFMGINLASSFENKKPIFLDIIPADKDFIDYDFNQVKAEIKTLKKSRELAKSGDCQKAQDSLSNINAQLFDRHYSFYWTLAEISLCKKEFKQAYGQFGLALKYKPAYLREKERISEQIDKLRTL